MSSKFALLIPFLIGWTNPIAVVRSSAQLVPSQDYLPEMLRTKGLVELTAHELASLPSGASLFTTTGAVVLPAIAVDAAAAQKLRDFVGAGGLLVALKPSSTLDDVFGVLNLGSSTAYEWITIDTFTRGGAGVRHDPMRLHGGSNLYSLTTASSLAALHTSPSAPISGYPAVTLNNYGLGRAVLFSFDLADSVALTRQGNPAWAGAAVDPVLGGYRPSAMFFREAPPSPRQTWNATLDTLPILNDVPQADELMTLLSNLIVRYARQPIPMLDTIPAGSEGVFLMTGDQCSEQTSATSYSTINFVESYGADYGIYLWHPYYIPATDVDTWLANGNEAGIHMNFFNLAVFDWNNVIARLNTFMNDFASAYPGRPAPRTVRTHALTWLTTNAAGAVDPIAQARAYLTRGIKMDTSFVAAPLAWGYMNGSGLPMKQLDRTTGEIVPFYVQSTQYEDDVQLSNEAYSTKWSIPTARRHIGRSLENARERYHTAVTINLHTIAFSAYPGYQNSAIGPVLSYAQSRGMRVMTAKRWLEFWEAREAASITAHNESGSELTFTVTHNFNEPMAILVPMIERDAVSVTVDSIPVSFRMMDRQGTPYARFAVNSGTRQVRVTFGAAHANERFLPAMWHECDGLTGRAGFAHFNGDNKLDAYCQTPNDDIRIAFGDGRGGFAPSFVALPSWCLDDTATFGTGRFNQDNFADLYCHDIQGSGNTWVALSNGSGGFNASTWLPSWCLAGSAKFGTADFTGDGLDDLYCHDVTGYGHTWIARSTGSSFDASNSLWGPSWCLDGTAAFGAADFTGDGRADLYCHDVAGSGNTWISRSTGTGLDSSNSLWKQSWCQPRSALIGTADFNNDQRADLYCHEVSGNGRTSVATSNGSTLLTQPPSPNGDGIWLDSWCLHGGAAFGTGDFNNDGRDDLYCHDRTGYGDTWVALSNGTSFTATPGGINGGGHWLGAWCREGNSFGAADLDGDGRDDFYCRWLSTLSESTALLVAKSF